MSKKNIEPHIFAYTCGTTVEIKMANIKGMITCIAIRFGKLTYEITYFLQGKQEVIWANENEFIVDTTKSCGKIGFGYKNIN